MEAICLHYTAYIQPTNLETEIARLCSVLFMELIVSIMTLSHEVLVIPKFTRLLQMSSL